MARYNRINLGDHQDTTTVKLLTEMQAGSVIDTVTLANPADGHAELGVVFEGFQEGLTTDDSIPAGHSAQYGRFYSGYTYAILADAGSYKKGDNLSYVDGKLAVASDQEVVAYADESVDLADTQLLKVRIK